MTLITKINALENLFGLSVYTRYEPDRWTRLIDINHFMEASAIEHLLEVAWDVVPDVVEETIHDVADTAGSMWCEPSASWDVALMWLTRYCFV